MSALVLGSASPYKQALLKAAGYTFIVDPADIAEEKFIQSTVEATVKFLAELKAQTLLPKYTTQDAVIITADVAGEFDGEFLGKPTSLEQAKIWLRSYSKQTMLVWCGTTIVWSQTGRTLTDVRSAAITYGEITDAMLAQYLQRTSPLDKGGALAIEIAQELGWVTQLTGEYDAIIGLSLEFIRQHIPCA